MMDVRENPAIGTVYVVVPEGIDDPARPSGGNAYDRRICNGLAVIGWTVHELSVPGTWPYPAETDCARFAGLMAGIPDGALVLLDGLVASTQPQALLPESHRLRLLVIVHLPAGAGPPAREAADPADAERAVLAAAVAVVTTSDWTRQWVVDRYALPPSGVHVVEPGVEPAGLVSGSAAGSRFLCVATVSPHKGHDVLIAALTTITDLSWTCVCVGDLTRDPGFVDGLVRQVQISGIGDRVMFTGPLVGAELEAAYTAADVLLLPSRGETYGMVVTESLARGIPVIATEVGGLPQTLSNGSGGSNGSDGVLPGQLVPPADPSALAGALRRWLGDVDLRRRLRHAALERRATLSDWSVTSARLSQILVESSK